MSIIAVIGVPAGFQLERRSYYILRSKLCPTSLLPIAHTRTQRTRHPTRHPYAVALVHYHSSSLQRRGTGWTCAQRICLRPMAIMQHSCHAKLTRGYPQDARRPQRRLLASRWRQQTGPGVKVQAAHAPFTSIAFSALKRFFASLNGFFDSCHDSQPFCRGAPNL